jgi:hypothetical protein
LRALIRTALETAVHDRQMWSAFVEFCGEMLHDARLRAINAQLYARMHRLVGALVERGIRAGDYRRVDVQHTAAVILGLLDGVSLQLTFDSRAFSVVEAARFCEEAVVRYLARPRRNS